MPGYYEFDEGNVQVADISRHLTSNGGQAVQYIARSCRLDGLNKGEQVGDLEKALWFIQDEINRLADIHD